MATGFVISIDDRDMREVALQLMEIPKKIPQALSAAINKSLSRAKTVIVNEIQNATTIKTRGRILKDARITSARPSNLIGWVRFTGRAVGATNFQHTVTRGGGVTVKAMKNAPPLRYRHGFKGIGASGNKHLFIRDYSRPFHKVTERAHHKPNVKRRMQFLKTIYGPTLNAIYRRNPQIEEAAHKVVRETLRENLYSQVDRFLGRTKTAVPNLAALT